MGQTGQDLTALVDELKALTARRAPLAERLRAIEERRTSTPQSIVDKVRKETLEKLDALDVEFRGRIEDARRARSDLAGQKALVTADLERLNEELEEVRFRRSVGEFSDDEFARIETAKQRDLEQVRARLQPLEEVESLLDEVLAQHAEPRPAPAETARASGHELEAMFGSAPYAPAGARVAAEEASRSAPTYIPPSPSHEISRPVERRTTAAFPALESEKVRGEAQGPAPERDEPAPAAAAGPMRPVLIVKTKDRDRGEDTYDLSSGQTLIGRAPENDIILLEESVSRRHARLIVEGPECFLEDLGSANGSYVNGERLRPKQPRKLQDNDVVKLGQLLALFRLNPED